VRGETREVSAEAGSRTLGFLATVLACAVSTGLIVITATVLVVDGLRSGDELANLELRFYVIVGGTLAGILLAAYVAWRLLEPITSTYRRGALAIVSAFATVLVMLVCAGIHQLFGRDGLLTFLAVCGVASALLARQARRFRAHI
jgi:hypothetical protein